jgi:ammonia channel protein AmtB
MRCGFAPAKPTATRCKFLHFTHQLLIQLYGVAVTLVWSGGGTFILLKLVSAFVPLRVSREQEMEASTFRSTARLCSNIPYLNTFMLPSPWALLCRQSVMRRF